MEEERKRRFGKIGTEEKREEVSADEVLNAIAEGLNIFCAYTIINGDLDIDKIEDRLDGSATGRWTIQGSINIHHSCICGKTNFTAATFSGEANFSCTTFSGDASFMLATFNSRAVFSSATFSEEVKFSRANFIGNSDFSSATFNIGADFSGATMKHPANFADVHFRENRAREGLWNEILRPMCWGFLWLLFLGRTWKNVWKRVREWKLPVTDFYSFNTTTMMDASSNPYLKRYIDDEQWIKSWRGRSWPRRWPLFLLWEIMSHCGRSLGLWAFCSASFATIFGFIYQRFGCDDITFNVDKLNGIQPGLLEYLYYSVVTFTTLGFGDIVPLTRWARFVVGLEVVLGYVMLGGLISIFANKFARRS